ncbi:hypothetical protein ACFYRI_14630 [Streptomyces microflavus]|uniref:hypothetical protein n=1 Tax=Streptomyces microflavus TaxID=1919 RepID=UPI0036C3B8E4
MTTTTRPLPAHGTYARGNGCRGYRAPCLCKPCKDARRRTNKLFRVNRERGVTSFVDPAPAQQHLQLLHQTMAWDDLAAATGLPLSTINLIYAGRRTKIRRETHNKILNTQPRPSRAQLVDVTGSMRRVQALMRVGHSLRVIATECRASRNRIHSISNGAQDTIRREFAERIAEAYKRLAFRPPARDRFTARTINSAIARGLHGPLAWDDETIEDPNASPDVGSTRDQLNRDELAAHRRADVAHLDGFGVSVEEIARRLGMAESTVKGIVKELRAGERRDRSKAAA